MKTSSITNRLSFRIIAPIVVALLLAGICLNMAISYVTDEYVGRIISDNLKERAIYIYSIADDSVDQLIRSKHSGDEKALRIKRAFTISAIEDYMRRHELKGAVFENRSTILLLDRISHEIINSATDKIGVNTVTYVRYDDQGYYIYHFEFEPWKWRIYLINAESEYAELISKVHYTYLFTGLLLLALILVFIFYLDKTIEAPVNLIIDRLKRGETPDYRGIYEFEFLSNNIGNILESLQGETARLNNIYHIAISKRGKEFFNEVTAATARMFDLNALIAKVNPGGESIYILSMSVNGVMRENVENPIGDSPCKEVIEAKKMLVIETGVSRQFPHAQTLAETNSESYACIPVFDRRGEVTGLINVFGAGRLFSDSDIKILQTIGQIVATEFELLEKTVSLDNILNSSTDTSIVSTDLDFRITYFNPAAERFFDVRVDDAIGLKLSDIEAIGKTAPEIVNTIMNEVQRKGEYNFSHEIRKDGSIRYIDSHVYGMLDDNSRLVGFVIMSRDITSFKKLEEQLLHSRKLEAVGLLAGGIAHEFNNILMTVMGYSSLLAIKTEETDPRKPYIDNILESSERAANLTRGMLAFSRKQIINPTAVHINQIVQRIDKLLRNVIEEDIELKTVLSDQDLTITADSGQIEQVLMNLVTNARDAMPNGGIILIKTAQETAGMDYIHDRFGLMPGKYAVISISDTGIGMDEATREHIFEPFFTNKDVGKGTGLGLSIAFGIIKQHGGNITVHSDPGQGSTFKIYLPMGSVLPPHEIFHTTASAPPAGSETILVVEDDSRVIDLVRDILTEFGYSVLCADSGNAMQVFEENSKSIELLLLDVVMPKKSGREVYEEIRIHKPDIKVIFMSGYSTEIIDKRGALKGGMDFIPKPISPVVLLTKIRETLDKQVGA
jgi:PAS domain S-box-containing protein